MLEEENLNINDIWNLYFKKGMTFEDMKEKYIDIIGDLYFVHGIHKVINLLSKMNTAPVYVYKFTNNNNFSMMKTMTNKNSKGINEINIQKKLKSYKFFL